VMSCRVCQADLGDVLAILKDMPASAQNLPLLDQLREDRARDLQVRQCLGCGLAQVDCEPVPYYREVIRAVAFSDEMRAFRRSQLRDFASGHRLVGKSVLEVGCGRGEYLHLLKEAGMVAAGTEYGEVSVAEAQRAGHEAIRVFPGDTRRPISGAPFSAFFSFNFMEHWPDPRRVLMNLAISLDEDAVGLVEVPNFDMLIEKRMATEFVADHLSYFTTESLANTLVLSGLEVLEIREVWYRYILSATVRRRKPLNLKPFETALGAQRRRVQDFIGGAGPNGIAVWGAGHQALAALALMELHDCVRYVVDSAPFKQGRFTPATHIPIVAPDTLDADPVGSILIMAAGFSDEVAANIFDRWGNRFRLAILREDNVEVVDYGNR